jgi:hypothetical protein
MSDISETLKELDLFEDWLKHSDVKIPPRLHCFVLDIIHKHRDLIERVRKLEAALNPFHPGSWSYSFWQEGYDAYNNNCPYEENSFPWEQWWDGRRKREALEEK